MKKVKIITNCPSCGALLERVKDQLFCRSSSCGATQTKKVLHFIKSMKIKGLGEKTVEKLEIVNIQDIYEFSEEGIINIMGGKLGTKIYQEIQFSQKTTLDKLLPAFSIPLIGNSAAKSLSSVVTNIDDITAEVCKQAKLGDKATNNLVTWIKDSYPQFRQLPIEVISIVSVESKKDVGLKVCLTGKLGNYSRAEATTFLEKKGIKVVSGVSKTLDYLINEDKQSSSKTKKAMEYNIPIVNIQHLIEEII